MVQDGVAGMHLVLLEAQGGKGVLQGGTRSYSTSLIYSYARISRLRCTTSFPFSGFGGGGGGTYVAHDLPLEPTKKTLCPIFFVQDKIASHPNHHSAHACPPPPPPLE